MQIKSLSFDDGHDIPARHAYPDEGRNISPSLEWSDLPEGVKELALICDDPDAPRQTPWVHWVIYKIPSTATGVPEGLPPSPTLQEPAGAVQGLNDWGEVGWGGPLPPKGHGIHRYQFRLYAISKKLSGRPGLTKADLLKAMKGFVLAQTEVIGTYERK